MPETCLLVRTQINSEDRSERVSVENALNCPAVSCAACEVPKVWIASLPKVASTDVEMPATSALLKEEKLKDIFRTVVF